MFKIWTICVPKRKVYSFKLIQIPLGKTVPANSLPQAPVLHGPRAESEKPGFLDVHPSFLIPDFRVQMGRNDFSQEKIVASQGDDLLHPAFEVDRALLDQGSLRFFSGRRE